MSLRDPRSHRYQRAESELRQHYAVLRAYLKGGAAAPPRTNKARDKLLRLSPVQFHELSTDVFDELQRRQAAQPLPGRPPRQDKVPPFLQPRPDFHEKRNQARQKLSSLQIARFRDLSTDVFCELERRFPHFNPDNRQSTRSISRGPPITRPQNGAPQGQNGFGPPPRAHTTQGSIASNAGFPPRKQSVASVDVNGANEFGRPMPKQFQANTITPNKSTMIEDDDDDDESAGPMGRYDRSSEAFGLESSLSDPRSNRDTSATSMTGGSRDTKSMYPPMDELNQKVSELERKLEAKDLQMRELVSTAVLKDELQQKLDQAESLNRSLREEIDRLRSEHAAEEDGGEWRSKHDELEQQHRSLKAKYDLQTKTTEEVSTQFKAHLAEIRALADESSSSMQREEQLHNEVQRLREETSEWKARYTKAKTQLKNVRLSTIGLNGSGAIGAHALGDQAFHAADGLISDVHVTKFQIAIDELLGSARGREAVAVLDHINHLVSAVRSITGDVEKAPNDEKTDEVIRKRNKLKGKVSATANNVITATKNFAAAQGLSPVSLLDAAASHLSAAVVDLIKTVKIRPASHNELADGEEPHMTPVNKNGYLNVSEMVRPPSIADSIYSALSDPAEPDPRTPVVASHEQLHVNGNGYGLGINGHLHPDDVELEELKVKLVTARDQHVLTQTQIYLGNQTDVVVQHVQALVGSVRNEEQMPAIRNHANSILDVVDVILGATENGMEQPSAFQTAFTNQTIVAYEKLGQCKMQFETAVQNSVQHDGKPSAREFSQSLPPIAFQIAREAKDLVLRAEKVAGDTHAEREDFS